jgi:hypothetical protein
MLETNGTGDLSVFRGRERLGRVLRRRHPQYYARDWVAYDEQGHERGWAKTAIAAAKLLEGTSE